MAAYAALVSLMNDLELIPNHQTHSFSFDSKQITSLSQTVNFLIDFMESYDSHGCTTQAAQAMESRIACVAHAAHDVIESHIVDQIHCGSTLHRKSRACFLLDLQKQIGKMDFIKRKAVQFKAKCGFRAEHPTFSAPSPLAMWKNVMVGFDAIVLRLLEMLTGEPSGHRALPIVGMGGMGKTTLAKNVYDHLLVQQHFDVRLWATISQEYSIEDILAQLLFSERGSDRNFNVLGEELHKMLWGRRYLVVLDDMWSAEAWDEIHMFLPDNGNGSCVIVTTRLSNLASHLSSSPFKMNFLDYEKSWQLFCVSAFGEEDCPVELEVIGKKIVKRCQGLPLSIVVIGGHLRRSCRAIEYWEKVANYMNPISSIGAEDQCLKIISLSYHHLPAYLKPCFLYMGIFQEDERIYACELLDFWVVEGFVKPKKGASLEEVADDYMKDLIDRNLILVDEMRWNGQVEYCVIHDIVRELCLQVAKKEKFMCVVEDSKECLGCRGRRVVIPKGKLNSHIVGAMQSAPLLRSLIRRREQFNFDQLWVEFRLLRVSANVNNVLLEKDCRCVPSANFQQVNLRYLAISCQKPTTIRHTIRGFSELPYSIPSSISQLWNMQTLIIMNYGVQISVPYEIWEMAQLRHLEFVRDCLLPDPLPGDRSNQQECIVLENLHTLLGVVNFRLTEEVCKRMPNIREFSVLYTNFCGDCRSSSYYSPRNLGRFNKLKTMVCSFGDEDKWRDIVLSFTFPTSLEKLSLLNCHLHWEDLRRVFKSLLHLGSLQLDSIQGPEWALVDEEFARLKVLRISDCYDLVYWNADSCHFPVLEILHIWRAPKMSEIPFDMGEIATLRLIEMIGCSASAAVSAMRIVVERESLGNQDLQLDIHFWEMEEVETFQKMVEEEGLKTSALRLHLP